MSGISRLVLSIAVFSSQNRSYLEPKAEDENDDERSELVRQVLKGILFTIFWPALSGDFCVV
jgi:hypothetical protein